MDRLAEIDGAAGGGQMLRSAVALSAVSGRPVRITNIRGARPQPGLRPQHLTAVQAAARVCSGAVSGAEIGSREIEFRPGPIASQPDLRLDIGTAGSVTLVLQCLLPALAHAPTRSALTLIGGTDVPFAPPFGYFQHVFAPALAVLGPRVEARLAQRGFYPRGGGDVSVAVNPSPLLRSLEWLDRGRVVRVRGCAASLGLPDHIVRRMRDAALAALRKCGTDDIAVEAEVAAAGAGEGCGIALWAECEGGLRFGGSALGRRGKRAEEVGEEAARALLSELRGAAAVDSHLADQLIVWLALAAGPSEFTTSRLTDHLRSACQVADAVVGARFELTEGPPARVRCHPSPSSSRPV